MLIYNKVLQKFICWVKMIHVFCLHSHSSRNKYWVCSCFFFFNFYKKKREKEKKATNYLISALFNKTAQLKSRNMIHDVYSENKIDAQILRSFVSK